MDAERWNIGLPGGPSGPFYSVVSSSGKVIAMQILDKSIAELLIALKPILDYDFDVVHEAGSRLRDIQYRDLTEYIIDPGSEDYVVKAVIEALFHWDESDRQFYVSDTNELEERGIVKRGNDGR